MWQRISVEFSFIAEHMMIKTIYMRDLLNKISESAVNGTVWYEKIINATILLQAWHSLNLRPMEPICGIPTSQIFPFVNCILCERPDFYLGVL